MMQLSFNEESGDSAPSDEDVSAAKQPEEIVDEEQLVSAHKADVEMKMDDDENPF